MTKFLTMVMNIWSSTQRVLLKIPILGWMIDLFTLFLSSFVFRFAAGHWVASNLDECERPLKTLKLYEYEICPFCRKVRETLSVLDLDCIIYPCPRQTLESNGYSNAQSRFRNEAKKKGGKALFPLLIDENCNETTQDDDDNDDSTNKNELPTIMYESDAIISYLWEKYGSNATAPPSYRLAQQSGRITLLLSMLVRNLPEYGLLRIPSRKPKKMLELWEFESSPYCKRVREVLSCLELPYLKRCAARGSMNRKEFHARFGHLLSSGRKKLNLIQVPLLVDPNTNNGSKDTVIIESMDIIKYLFDTYKVGEMEHQSWDKYSSKKSE